jgi:hypothetical protein
MQTVLQEKKKDRPMNSLRKKSVKLVSLGTLHSGLSALCQLAPFGVPKRIIAAHHDGWGPHQHRIISSPMKQFLSQCSSFFVSR